MVKEADALCNAGYEVKVLYSYWNAWGTEFDKQLMPTKKWKAICIGGDPKKKRLVYFISKVIYKIAKIINRKTKGKMLADIAISRSAWFLSLSAKKNKADIYIAHNIGALPAVVAAAKANNKPCCFDAEDFHRNETSNDVNNYDVILKSQVEDRYIPRLTCFTTSSPQIAAAYQNIFAGLKPVVLLNVFPKSTCTVTDPNGPLKLFWFSQTIGSNRGLDDVVGALQLLDKSCFELHLLGDQLPSAIDFITEIIDSGITVKFHPPIHPDRIIPFANQFDIGLALENNVPYNRDICLTNKIFTYMQAGLAIIASDTTAQNDFINKNPTIGHIYPKGNTKAMVDILLRYHQYKEQLTITKSEALRLGYKQYNWEVESLKLLEIVKTTFNAK